MDRQTVKVVLLLGAAMLLFAVAYILLNIVGNGG